MQTNSTAADAGQLTASPVAVPAVTATPIFPEWIRLPKSGQLCPWTGLSRSKLNELVLPTAGNNRKAPVRSICLRKKGAQKGCRLIYLKSLLDYLEAQGREQSEGSPAT